MRVGGKKTEMATPPPTVNVRSAMPLFCVVSARKRQHFWGFTLCFVCLCFGTAGSTTANYTLTNGGPRERRVPDEQRLYETIMEKYQQSVMPFVDNSSYTLTVAFSLRLNQIVNLDERKQVLTTNVFIDQTWKDPGLAWNRSDFINVRALRIPAEHVWLPDTFVYNNADGGTSGFMRGTYVQIQSNGRVLWPVPLRLRSSCVVHITYFPFDSQICTLRFGSWIYGSNQLDYTQLTDGLTLDPSSYVNNSEWELVNITMHKAMSQHGGPRGLRRLGPHPHLTYVMHLKRNTFFYLFNIIVPCGMLSTLNILTFWLPPISGEKVTLGLSVFLAFSMFMLLIAEEVPASSEAVPLIGVYLCMVMALTSMSVIMAVVVTNLYHRGRKMRRAPRWLVTVCLEWLARPFCVTNDIPLIASSVDLAEHCQYDVAYKRRSQPRLNEVPNSPESLNTNTVITTTTNNNGTSTRPPCSPTSRNQAGNNRSQARVPTHLQNGGRLLSENSHVVLAAATRRGRRRQEASAILEVLRPSARRNRHNPPPATTAAQVRGGGGGGGSSTAQSFFNRVAMDKKPLREVHPRARNSVVTSCHFTKIPTTTDDDDYFMDDTLRKEDRDDTEEEKEEEVVWLKREDLDSHRSSQSDLSPSRSKDADDNEEENNKDDDEEEEYDEDGDGNEVFQSLLAADRSSSRLRPSSATTHSRDYHHIRNSADEASNNFRNHAVATASSSSRRSQRDKYSRRRGDRQSQTQNATSTDRTTTSSSSSSNSNSNKLDAHPSSSDLQTARTMIAEWQQIATVVDRLMFVFYVLTTVTAYVIILVIVPANQPPVTDLMLDAAGTDSATITHALSG